MKQKDFIDKLSLLDGYNSNIELECDVCGKVFKRKRCLVKRTIIKSVSKIIHTFCSRKCQLIGTKANIIICANCRKQVKRLPKEVEKSKSGKNFCSHSCAAFYNNTHKITGNRISKLEIWLSKKLLELYPDLEIIYNGKETIKRRIRYLYSKFIFSI
jgi:hypothetical protein